MASGNSWTKSLFIGLWTGINFTRKLILNILFFSFLILIVVLLSSGKEQVTIPNGAAFLLNPYGNIVIQKVPVDPIDKIASKLLEQPEENPEVLLQDIVLAIDTAKDDKKINVMVMDLSGLQGGGMDKLEEIARAIDRFKESGKPVYAIGDFYTQNQYYLAAHADQVFLNPMGFLMFEGFGRYSLYYKSMLDKLMATTHVFRVGTYKSYVEPYIRDDMSDAAKEANLAWLSEMWGQYKQNIAEARSIDVSNFDEKIEQFMAKFDAVNGDFAKYAKENHWVDDLKTRDEVIDVITQVVDEKDNKRGYEHVTLNGYIKYIKPPHAPRNKKDAVGIVVAKGSILNGTQKPGTIGGDSTAALLKKARKDDKIKAVVLHVDSPGGSAFASEIIRREVELLKQAGKPVVVSMSSVAASGGYWISADADEIWATPTTITGSIGVFGMFMTYEKSLDYIGVHADGVGTTDFSGLSQVMSLDPRIGDVFQKSVENTYDEFLSLVSRNRGMTKEEVDNVAQGRVWIGITAKELGLVDQIGYLSDAVASAANLAGMDKVNSVYIQPPRNDKGQLWNNLFSAAANALGPISSSSDGKLLKMLASAMDELDKFKDMNDPKGTYAFCLPCDIK